MTKIKKKDLKEFRERIAALSKMQDVLFEEFCETHGIEEETKDYLVDYAFNDFCSSHLEEIIDTEED